MGEVFGSIVGTGVGFFSKFDDEMTVREYLTDFIVRNRHWPNCTADDLTLFLAKWNGKWLHHQDLDYLEMRKCDIPDGIKETMNDANRMSPERRLKDFDFPGPDECGGIGALVLLQVPDHIVRQYRLNMIESRCYLYGKTSNFAYFLMLFGAVLTERDVLTALADLTLWQRLCHWAWIRKTKKRLGL
ncbi:hypothetical protein PHYSODRAFT_305625 [Phytophthora sojae]|uniref:Uncharacterized protein n=1 Tax=Phytophthora sojae (strain P6497) TaxID=1094619 RepID=G5A5V4_PHYSP|nr:hypothetical protein PHYSODRAFT_305625 [Phytophthora sojae]EGZ08709.1 hypothetical protein PHYSODRAFT_305625 [Phytophthora sojae]|eukprot:XP_009535342.1 hypothetical protein PHYSODRAFT_305625 [Phytophthora sojae]